MDIEKECTLLGNLFHLIVTDLKVGKIIIQLVVVLIQVNYNICYV